MSALREQLCEYGRRISAKGLVAGAGGNISAREGTLIWMKPSGLAMEDLSAEDYVGVDLKTGQVVEGRHKPTSEVNMHRAIYREREDVTAVFHTHSPWASGVISSEGGEELRAMFAEFVCDLGRVATLPYITPTTEELAEAVALCAREADTMLMRNHGVCALGTTLKQAYFRAWVTEDAAKSLLAAKIMGTPIFLTASQITDLTNLEAPRHRIAMMQSENA